jgi:hypothetical protein
MRLPFVPFSLLAVMAVPAQAQDAAPCELHFWPSGMAMMSNYSGVAGPIGAALAGPSPQSGDGLISDLPPAAQGEALKSVDFATLLKLPQGVTLIVEPSSFPGKPGRKGPRASASTAPCYLELVVDYIGYTSHITAGRKFGARMWLRRYPTGGGDPTVQNGGKDVKLRLYPAKKAEDHPTAIAELNAAFPKVIEGFLLNKVK